MDLPSAIFARLRLWGPLDQDIGASSTDARRVYHRVAPPGTPMPFVVFLVVSDVPYKHLAPGDSGLRRALVQVETWAAKTLDATRIGAEVRRCALAFLGTWYGADGSSLIVRDCREESTQDDDDDPADGANQRDQRQMTTFVVTYRA